MNDYGGVLSIWILRRSRNRWRFFVVRRSIDLHDNKMNFLRQMFANLCKLFLWEKKHYWVKDWIVFIFERKEQCKWILMELVNLFSKTIFFNNTSTCLLDDENAQLRTYNRYRAVFPIILTILHNMDTCHHLIIILHMNIQDIHMISPITFIIRWINMVG
jgi:hypothetical protein